MVVVKNLIAGFLIFGAFILCVWFAGLLPADHWGFAIAVNFLFMIIFTIIFDTLISPIFSEKYFRSKPFEKEGSIYRWFGIMYYKRALKLIGWEKIIRKDQRIKHNLDALTTFERWTQGSEAIHLFAAISVIAYTVWVGWSYSIREIRWFVIANIIVNVYPVMLQRYNRPRIYRLIRYQQVRIRNK